MWITLTLNAWIFLQFGRAKGLEFRTGYLSEKSLSVDNVFVFILLSLAAVALILGGSIVASLIRRR